MNLMLKKEEIIPVLILAGILFYIFIFKSLCEPLLGTIHQNQEQHRAYLNETAALKKIFELGHNKSTIHLVPANKVNELKEKISNLASKNNIILSYQDLAKKEENEEASDIYKRMLIDAEVSGNFKDMGHFLNELKNIPEGFVDIDKIFVSADYSESSNLLAQITLGLYLSQDNAT